MSKKRSLWTLEEWNFAADRGRVVEPAYTMGLIPHSGVGCPASNKLIGGGVCGAHLTDRFGTKLIRGKLHRRVKCYVCGWKGHRRIGKEPHTNGRIR